MRRALSLGLSWIALVSITASLSQAAPPSKSLGTITGTVKDNKGNPLTGALVSLLREGAKQVKEARTDDKGNFIARVLPGRYGIRAIATGFRSISTRQGRSAPCGCVPSIRGRDGSRSRFSTPDVGPLRCGSRHGLPGCSTASRSSRATPR